MGDWQWRRRKQFPTFSGIFPFHAENTVENNLFFPVSFPFFFSQYYICDENKNWEKSQLHQNGAVFKSFEFLPLQLHTVANLSSAVNGGTAEGIKGQKLNSFDAP